MSWSSRTVEEGESGAFKGSAVEEPGPHAALPQPCSEHIS